MKFLVIITFALTCAVCSPTPALERWQANFRGKVRAGFEDYLPGTPHSAERLALLRETCALPDSAYRN